MALTSSGYVKSSGRRCSRLLKNRVFQQPAVVALAPPGNCSRRCPIFPRPCGSPALGRSRPSAGMRRSGHFLLLMRTASLRIDNQTFLALQNLWLQIARVANPPVIAECREIAADPFYPVAWTESFAVFGDPFNHNFNMLVYHLFLTDSLKVINKTVYALSVVSGSGNGTFVLAFANACDKSVTSYAFTCSLSPATILFTIPGPE